MATTTDTGDRGIWERRARLAEALEAARNEFATDARIGHGGVRAHVRLSDRVDGLVSAIVADASSQTAVRVAVCAIGGYGRRRLCLHSDIDLLIIVDGRIGAAEERFVKAVLHPIWDLRLTVGHQIRELAELADPMERERLERDNPEFLLALTDTRFLAGVEEVGSAVRAPFVGPGSEQAPAIASALLALVSRRHAQFNDTVYQLEPDVKDAPGGIRDVDAARLLRALTKGERKDAEEMVRLAEAEEFLLRARSILHLETGRNLNTLTHPLQEIVAEALGYLGSRPHQRVEMLMGDYFRHARFINRALERTRRLARPPEKRRDPLNLGDNVEVVADGVRFVDPTQAMRDPDAWLRLFARAVEHGSAASDDTLALLERVVDRLPGPDFVDTEFDRQVLMDFLRPKPGLYARLTEMRDCGLLSRIFPEFERVQCRVIRDFYHRYTVDEHTLLTIRNLESLIDAPGTSRRRFAALLGELHEPELLTLALIYHDVGKWKDEDHASESVRMAATMLDRLKLRPEARHTVEFLIGQHLQMSHVAFRRDSEDPEVVRRFADLVGTETHLKLLCLMTFADVGAVSPDTLTPWKEELLWRLYVDTYNHLTLSYADEVIDRRQAGPPSLLADRPADITESEIARFLGGLPRRYLALFNPETIFRHVRLARDIQPDHVHLFLERKADVWDLTVVTLDKRYLFSNISGVLAYFGMNILRGQAMTSTNGLVVDVFEFTDQEGFFHHNPDAIPQFHQTMQDAVAGLVDVPSLLSGRRASPMYRRPQRVDPVIYFDNEHSHRYTILEIVADDAVGLLHRVSRVISEQGCDVDLVLISTEGHKAIDVFHLTKDGAKVDDAAQRALKDNLAHMLEAAHETH
jgi:[protein-PII] uridylyltransferase